MAGDATGSPSRIWDGLAAESDRSCERGPAEEVVSDREQEHDTQDFLRPADRESGEAVTLAELRVDPLGATGSFSIGGLGLVRLHACVPGLDFRSVPRPSAERRTRAIRLSRSRLAPRRSGWLSRGAELLALLLP